MTLGRGSGHDRQDLRSGRQTLATATTAGLDDRLTGTGRHAVTEPVLACTTPCVGLIGTLHRHSRGRSETDRLPRRRLTGPACHRSSDTPDAATRRTGGHGRAVDRNTLEVALRSCQPGRDQPGHRLQDRDGRAADRMPTITFRLRFHDVGRYRPSVPILAGTTPIAPPTTMVRSTRPQLWTTCGHTIVGPRRRPSHTDRKRRRSGR